MIMDLVRWIPKPARQLGRVDNNTNTQDELSNAAFPFTRLPTDIALEIMKVTQVRDMIALSMTNRTIHNLSGSPSLWISQARTHLALSRPLVIVRDTPSQRLSFLSNVSPSTLRTVVLNAARLSQAWSRPLVTPIAQPSLVKLGDLWDSSPCSIIRVTPSHFLVIRDDIGAGNGAQELVGWDVQRDRHMGGVCFGRALVSFKPEWMTRSFYCVTGACLGSDRFEFTITHVQIRETAAQLSDPIDEPATSTESMTDDILAHFVMPNSVGIGVRILDVRTRTAVAMFECGNSSRGGIRTRLNLSDEPTTTLALVIILDWKVGLSVAVDTGLPFHYRTTSASLHLVPTCSHLLVHTERNICVDEDAPAGGHNALRTRQKQLDLDRLKQRAKSWDETIAEASKFVKIRDSSEVRWAMDRDSIRGAETNNQSGKGGEQADGSRIDYEWGSEAALALVGGSGIDVLAAAEMHSVPATPFRSLSRYLSTSRVQPQARTPTLEIDESEMICNWVRHEDWPSFHEMDGRASLSAPHEVEAEAARQPTGAPTSARSSKVSLYSSTPSHGPISPSAAYGRVWYLVQSYVRTDEAESTVPPPPTTVLLHSPVILEGAFDSNHNPRTRFMPLMAISYNYACWLEDVPGDMDTSVLADEGGNLRPYLVPRRLLKLASFRGPEDARLKPRMLDRDVRIVSDGNGNRNEDKKVDFASVTTLDIPNGDTVLCNARHLLLSETKGTISVVSGSRVMHTYSFV